MTQGESKRLILALGIILALLGGVNEASAQSVPLNWTWMTPGSYVTYNVYHVKTVPQNPLASFRRNWTFTWTVTAVAGSLLTIQEDSRVVQYDAFSRRNVEGTNYARWWLPKNQRMTTSIMVDGQQFRALRKVTIEQDSWSRPAWQLAPTYPPEGEGAAQLVYLHYDMGVGILLYYAIEYPDQFYRMVMNNTNTIPTSALKAALPSAALYSTSFTVVLLAMIMLNEKKRRR